MLPDLYARAVDWSPLGTAKEVALELEVRSVLESLRPHAAITNLFGSLLVVRGLPEQGAHRSNRRCYPSHVFRHRRTGRISPASGREDRSSAAAQTARGVRDMGIWHASVRMMMGTSRTAREQLPGQPAGDGRGNLAPPQQLSPGGASRSRVTPYSSREEASSHIFQLGGVPIRKARPARCGRRRASY